MFCVLFLALQSVEKWLLGSWLRFPPSMAPRVISLAGSTADAPIFSDACATGKGPAAVVLFRNGSGSCSVVLTVFADATLAKCCRGAEEIKGLEMRTMAAPVVSLGERPRGERVVSFLNYAAVGASIKASSRVAVVLPTAGSSRRSVARLSASRWVERAPSVANTADAPCALGPSRFTQGGRRFRLVPTGA